MPFHLSQMNPFFPPLGRKLSYQLSGQTTKPRRHAILSETATARAETAPTSAHALDVESLKRNRRQFSGHGEYAARCPLLFGVRRITVANCAMSAIGTKRTFVFALQMSAFGAKADMVSMPPNLER
jgi:hypothetical protein